MSLVKIPITSIYTIRLIGWLIDLLADWFTISGIVFFFSFALWKGRISLLWLQWDTAKELSEVNFLTCAFLLNPSFLSSQLELYKFLLFSESTWFKCTDQIGKHSWKEHSTECMKLAYVDGIFLHANRKLAQFLPEMTTGRWVWKFMIDK